MKKLTYTTDIGPGCLMSFAKLFVIMFIAVLFSSCKATKVTQKTDRTTNDSTAVVKTETAKSDSTSVASSSTKDVNQTNSKTDDSSSQATSIKDNDTNTLITYGPNGTYNEQTGEHTNIASLNISKKENELQTQLNVASSTINEQYKAIENQQLTINVMTKLYENSQDSVNLLNEKLKSTTSEKTTPKDNWYWWLFSGAVLMFLVIIILKMIPATRWLVAWLK